MSRVLIELQEDVEDGNTGDPLWSKGQRIEVDPVSAKHYLKTGVAVLAEDADTEDAEDATDEPVSPEAREQLERLEQRLAEAESAQAVLTDDDGESDVVGEPADGDDGDDGDDGEAGQVVDGDGVVHTGVVPTPGFGGYDSARS